MSPPPRLDATPYLPTSPTSWPSNLVEIAYSELSKQRGIVLPLVAMNLSWFAKLAITTAFLGRLGEPELAGGTLGLTFANVTGFSVLNGLCCAMEPICGQAYGAKNFKLLHKTLMMMIILLLLVTLPICFLWLNINSILLRFGQQKDLIFVAQRYLLYLLPDLPITSLLCPLKAYLNSQGVTIPTMLSSALGVAFHIPINILMLKLKGLEGISMAVWVTDLVAVILLAIYVLITETSKGSGLKEGGWLDQRIEDWITLLRISGPCCLTTCLEWWCYEILFLLAGRLANAKQAVGVLAIVLNFDYLLYSVMLSLATSASIRVSNELGANKAEGAYQVAHVSVATGFITGCLGALIMVTARGSWGPLFSHDRAVISQVRKMMMLMALIEVVNFPMVVCGSIVRGTGRPSLATYANLGGFYLLALPLGVSLAYKARIGLGGLLMGFLAGSTLCLTLLLIFIAKINWVEEASKAQDLAHCNNESANAGADSRVLQRKEDPCRGNRVERP